MKVSTIVHSCFRFVVPGYNLETNRQLLHLLNKRLNRLSKVYDVFIKELQYTISVTLPISVLYDNTDKHNKCKRSSERIQICQLLFF